MNKHAKALFDKEMNRREFLGHIGAFLLAAVGISGIVRYFLHGGASGNSSNSKSLVGQTMGYGSGAYGGRGE